MITGKDFYNVLAAIVPLYVAMILAYGSVRWWKIFTPEQCAGISRFVAVFAVPFLTFKFVSYNDPYNMNFRFIGADCLQKVVILVVLFLWNTIFSKYGSIDWMITLYALSTLPNTLVMGVPLLSAMYGDFSANLMVQIVVFQGVVWNTLLLILYEYRGAKLLISEQFPDTAGSIVSLRADSDVISLDGREPLQADAEIGEDGKLHVVVKRSVSNTSMMSSFNGSRSRSHLTTSMTPRASNVSGVEIYSVQSSREPTPRSSFNQTDFCSVCGGTNKATIPKHGYTKSFQNNTGFIGNGDVSLLQPSNFEDEMDKKRGRRSMSVNSDKLFNGGLVTTYPPQYASFGQRNRNNSVVGCDCRGAANNNDLHMFVWTSSASSPVSEGNLRHGVNRSASTGFGTIDPVKVVDLPNETAASIAVPELIPNMSSGRKVRGDREHEIIDEGTIFSARGSPYSCQKKVDIEGGDAIANKKQEMPSFSVMARLIVIMVWRKLIRNPNTYASLLGIVWALLAYRWHFKMPTIIKGSIEIISNAGMGMAMFILGLFMALQPKFISCGYKMTALSFAVRFLVGPLVIAATAAAIGIRGVLLQVAIVQAALPQGIVTFVFAREYNVHADILSTSVIFGMVVAIPVTIIYYVIVGL